MAGHIYFDPNGFSGGSTYIEMLGIYLWPYINEISPCVTDQVYREYRFVGVDLDFSHLTTEVYMLCYQQICRAFESDLVEYPFIRGFNYKEALYDWFHEIKPAMLSSKLYNQELLYLKPSEVIINNFINSQADWLTEFIAEAQAFKESPEYRGGSFENDVIYPEYYQVMRTQQQWHCNSTINKCRSFIGKYSDMPQKAVSSLVARCYLFKYRCENRLEVYSSEETLHRLIENYGKSNEECIKFTVNEARRQLRQ